MKTEDKLVMILMMITEYNFDFQEFFLQKERQNKKKDVKQMIDEIHINDLLDQYEKIPCLKCGRLSTFYYSGHLEGLMIECPNSACHDTHEWEGHGVLIDLEVDDEELQEYIQKYQEKFIRKTGD
jgi:hypothetical protein